MRFLRIPRFIILGIALSSVALAQQGIQGGADAERIVRLMDVLEELEDVSKVFSNFDVDAAQLAEAEA